MAITLDSVTISTPQTFRLGWKKINKTTQLSSGKTVADIIARKRVFSFAYTIIDDTELEKILDVLDTDTFAHTLTYPESDGTTGSKTVYLDGDITGDLLRNDSTQLYKNISFTLAEQ